MLGATVVSHPNSILANTVCPEEESRQAAGSDLTDLL